MKEGKNLVIVESPAKAGTIQNTYETCTTAN